MTDQMNVPSQDVFFDVGGAEHSFDRHAPDAREGVPPFFQTAPLEAVPVSQRASDSVHGRAVSFVEPYKIAGYRKGRRSITLSCPATITGVDSPVTPPGFQWSDDRTYLELNAGFQVNPGDSVRIESEAVIWVAPLNHASAGYCQYVETFDSPSGPNP